MKTITLSLFIALICIKNAVCSSIYVCDKMKGYTTLQQSRPTLIEKLKFKYIGVDSVESLSDMVFVVDGERSYAKTSDSEQKTPLFLIQDTEEKVELLEIGTLASSIYTIDKKHKKLYQAKNGVIVKGYQIIMESNCR
jgi:hypothetical protein